MKNTKIKWRLGSLPTPDEVRELVRDEILTKEEAREILFNLEVEEMADKESLKAEIKFLRDVVSKLSNNQPTKIIETIREVEKRYHTQPWYTPYSVYCGGVSGTGATMYMANGTGGTTLASSNLANYSTTGTANFSSIKTF